MSAPHAAVDTAPPPPRELVRIALGLTVVCLVASLILGGVYLWTEPAKARNLAAREQRLIREMLGLSPTATVHEVRRYLVWRGTEVEVLYLTEHALLRMDTAGRLLETVPVPGEVAERQSPEERDEWVQAHAGAGAAEEVRFAGRYFAGREDGRPAGYVIESRTPGFKTWIRFFLAIDADYGLRGLEVIEHEEDPGLGAEITEPYFKHQYAGRSFADIERIEVTKDPMPNAWRAAVESREEMTLAAWLDIHGDELAEHPDIHSITGSTISSEAVNDGVKRALGNFKRRMALLEKHL